VLFGIKNKKIMKKNVKSELNRVQEIMGIKPNLVEQNISIGKTIVTGKEETFKAGKPITVTMDKEATYVAMDSDPKKVVMPFYNELVKKLQAILGDNIKTADSGLKLVKAKIIAGASNYYDGGSTEADIMNDRKTAMPKLECETVTQEDHDPPDFIEGLGYCIYESPTYGNSDWQWIEHRKDGSSSGNKGGTSSGYKDNKALALSRGTKFLAYLKELLMNKGIDVLQPLTEEIVEAFVVDTGGVIDRNRNKDADRNALKPGHERYVDSAGWPNPGQFITMQLEFLKEVGGGQVDDVLSCLVDMNIKVAYYKASNNHNCDAAIFTVLMNKNVIGTANLNNYNDPSKGPYADSKKSRIKSGGGGGTRVCQFIIDNAKAQKILAGSKNPSKIEMGIKGAIIGGTGDGGGKPKYKDVYNGDPKNRGLHASVPHVRIADADGNEFYAGFPEVNMKRGDTSYKKIIIMDVCKQEVDDNVG
tara:strand:- start:2610 stop:4031 length:1422 start_codon:yes stop_codon:yes gene_type:complete